MRVLGIKRVGFLYPCSAICLFSLAGVNVSYDSKISTLFSHPELPFGHHPIPFLCMGYVFEREVFSLRMVLYTEEMQELMNKFLAVFSFRRCYGSAVFSILESCPAVLPK